MNVSELISLLESYDGEMEVRLASQPSWPFEWSVAGVASDEDVRDAELENHRARCADRGMSLEEMEESWHSGDEDRPARPILFIAEGAQEQYGSKAVWDVVGR